ncbi:hypothetical protein H4N58_11900 [Mumia sp. ZJ1417]|uniref:hypothetical protein n=1 Tax=Mumia sp. ZJ1417 TaxID=2708082 RepID=UPI00141F709B|nr:hypothetical protein [Mumia sp. ZJ1417]QMW64935.1 hypothetical protein H4N58_11900 [Mumia sp. ZJ1417]
MLTRRILAAATAAMTAGGLVLADAGPGMAAEDPPSRTIAGDRAKVRSPAGLAVGPDGTTYVLRATNPTTVRVFGPGARGNARPVRVQKPAVYVNNLDPLATDSAGRLYALSGGPRDVDTIVKVYPRGATSRKPLRTLELLDDKTSIAVSPSGEIATNLGGDSEVQIYSRTARGRATPTRVIDVPAETSAGSLELALGGDGRLWVAGATPNTLLSYAPGARGNVAPDRRVAGPRTGLGAGAALDVDAAGRVYVTQYSGSIPRISVFAPSANGDAAPLRVLTVPPKTRPRYQRGDDVGPRGDIVVPVGADAVRIYRTMFPTRASKVRAVRVTGKSAAAKRTVRWKKPSYDGGRAVRSYKVVIRKGTKVLRTKTLGPMKRSYVVNKKSLRRGKLTVTVRAKTSMGWSPKVVRPFRVR